MNVTRWVFYLSFLSDLEQKIVKTNKHKKSCFYNKGRQAIKEFCIDNKRQLFYISLEKKYITWSQAFIYNQFEIIAQIYIALKHNGYKKIYQRMKNKAYRVSKDDFQCLLNHFQIYIVNCQNITRTNFTTDFSSQYT